MSDVTLPKTEEELKAAIGDATKGIRAELSEERAKRSEFEKQLKQIQAKLDESEKAKNEESSAKEKAALEAKGEYDKALAKVTDTYTKKLAEFEGQIKMRDDKISELMIDGKIMSMAENAVNPGQVVTLMKATHKFVIENGEVVVQSPDGKPMLDDKGKPVTVDGAYETFMGSNPHLVKPGSTTGGSGARNGIPNTQKSTGDIGAQIAKAQKAGNRQEVIKLKARKMSLGGPRSLMEQPQTGVVVSK